MSGSIPVPDSVASTLADVIVRQTDGVRAYGSDDLMGLLFWVAVFAVVVGAIVAIVKAKGIQIPEVVKIVFWALVSIGLIIILFRAFAMVF